MTIETFIEKLQVIQKSMPGAVVKYGDLLGPDISPKILCLQSQEEPKLSFVCLADCQSELEIMFSEYYGKLEALGVPEYAFYTDLLKYFSLDDVKKYVPERYEHAKQFCEMNGLL